MKVEWLYEAQAEFRDILLYYKTNVGKPYARKFSEKIRGRVRHLADFPEMGVLREETLLGKHGFRALFIDQYACIYKIEGDIVYIYHLVDARRDYIYEIFGMKG